MKGNCKQCDPTKKIILSKQIKEPCICFTCDTIYLLKNDEVKTIDQKEATKILKQQN